VEDTTIQSYQLTEHASIVIMERGIHPNWIEKAIQQPDWTEPDLFDNSLTCAFVAIPEFGGRMLRIVFDDSVEPKRVITVYFDRNARRRK